MPQPEAGIARIAEAVDEQLLRDGLLQAVPLLQSLRLLPPDAELPAWPVDIAAAQRALNIAQEYCERQGLEAVADAAAALLPESETPERHEFVRRCRCVMRRPDSATQLDLFHDSRGAYAEASVRAALVARNTDEARAALARCEDSATAQALARLIDAVTAPPVEIAVFLDWADRDIRPLARRHLGSDAGDYLARLWADCAERGESLPFDPARPLEHASHAWLRAGDGERARACIEREPEWQQHATLCSRHARSLARSGRTAEARLAWMQLCWRHPQEAEAALDDGADDAGLAPHWRSFRSAEIEYTVPEFPAWMLLADVRHIEYVPVAAAADDAAGAAYDALLVLIRSGGEMVARWRLHALRPALLAAYLAAYRPQG